MSSVSCVDNLTYRTRCDCFKSQKSCTRSCRCRNCGNRDGNSPKYTKQSDVGITKCFCGKNAARKDPNFVACYDADGQQKSKCPCYGNNQSCSLACICFNCGNTNGKNTRSISTNVLEGVPKVKRSRSTPIFHKRKRGTEYLSSSGFGIRDGPWLRTESIVFIVCLTLLSKTTISPSVDNLLMLYNSVVTSEYAIKTEYGARRKTKAHVIAKMKHIEETLNYHVNFF